MKLSEKMPAYLLKNKKTCAPRQRAPGEATAPTDNLFAREPYDPAKHGDRRQVVRVGADDHLKHLSLPPQPGVPYSRGHA